MKSKNTKLLKDFTKYCEKYPEMRFFQALVNWCGYDLYAKKSYDNKKIDMEDVFYWADSKIRREKE
jgi:hypothetical protein